MPFDQQTLEDIRAVQPDGWLRLDRQILASGPRLAASWQTEAETWEALGKDEGDALDHLLLVVSGKVQEVDKDIRLEAALAREAEAQAVLDRAKGEREAIEAEVIVIEVPVEPIEEASLPVEP